MRTYDPKHGMVYRHIARQIYSNRRPVTSTLAINHLPPGYANRSPRTLLGRTRPTSLAA
jgi:hypothetical protein